MSEINLLQSRQEVDNKFKVLNIVGLGFLFLAIAAYVLFFALSVSMDSKKKQAEEDSAKIQAQIESQDGYKQLLSEQQRTKNLEVLLNKHLAWSEVLPKFAAATLKTAVYTKFQANKDGSATITGVVTDFQQLDKLIKAFQLPEFSYIKDVKLVNVALASEDKNGITFTIKVTFNNNLLSVQ